MNARSEDKLKGAADEIKASGGDVAIAVGDVSKVNKGCSGARASDHTLTPLL